MAENLYACRQKYVAWNYKMIKICYPLMGGWGTPIIVTSGWASSFLVLENQSSPDLQIWNEGKCISCQLSNSFIFQNEYMSRLICPLTKLLMKTRQNLQFNKTSGLCHSEHQCMYVNVSCCGLYPRYRH